MPYVVAKRAPPPAHTAPKRYVKAKGDGTTLPVTSALVLIQKCAKARVFALSLSPFKPVPNI